MFAFDFTEVRLSGVQVFRGGQAGVLARYPIHFHFANDTSERAFIKDCTVHESYQRCFTIHHTDSLLIQRNVGYKARGHCFFLEDGIETNNKFYWNLGMQTLTPFSDTEQLIPTDDDPAVFWVTNPNNTFVSNVAAGGRSHCWWIALPVNPMGPSATPTMCPRRTPLQYFAHNKAHSCGQDVRAGSLSLLIAYPPLSSACTLTADQTPMASLVALPLPLTGPTRTATIVGRVSVQATTLLQTPLV